LTPRESILTLFLRWLWGAHFGRFCASGPFLSNPLDFSEAFLNLHINTTS